MRYRTIEEPRYLEQQEALKRIAQNLGLVYYLPDYHGAKHDKNTVLFYTQEAFEHNAMVDIEMGAFAARNMYKDYEWWFENTDYNGRESYDFANHGRIDLRGLHWEKRLATYIVSVYALRLKPELDCIPDSKQEIDIWNDNVRTKIELFKKVHGRAYIGSYNVYENEKREGIASGEINPLERLADQPMYNFFCDFCVPDFDDELAAYLRQWSSSDKKDSLIDLVRKIQNRIDYLGGIHILWR